jgi:gliding motility-associated-like protein
MKKNITLIVLFVSIISYKINAQQTLIDSLEGFNTKHAWEHTNNLKTLEEKNTFYEQLKRNWLKRKYNLFPVATPNENNATSNKQIGGPYSTMQGPQPANCTNIDFESGNTTSWVTSGLTQVVSGAGLDPNCGFPMVYPGGNSSLKISGDWTVPGSGACFCTSSTAAGNFCMSQASRVISVAAGNTQLQLHYAFVVYEYPLHSAAESAYIEVSILSAAGVQLACPYFKINYVNGAFNGIPGITAISTTNTINGCTGNYSAVYIPWQTVNADLSPYVGQNVTIVAKVKWCAFDCDWAYAYIDADCLNTTYNLAPVCAGNQACAPAGFATYTWTAPGGVTSNGQCITPQTTGIYTVIAAPTITCSPPQTITLSVVSSFTPSVNSTNVNCNGGANGAATVSCIGTGPFTYTWLPAGTNASTINALVAGNYSVLATDGGCTITKTFTITQPPTLNITAAQTTSVVCLNGNNGVATATATGGTLPYTYTWTPSNNTASVATNLIAGSYSVQVTDANGCINTATALINQPGVAFLTLGNTPVSCHNGSDGTASVTTVPVLNTGPYSYTWSTNPIQNTAIATGLIANTIYTCVLTNTIGCTFTGTTSLFNPTSVSVTISTSTTQACAGLPISFAATGAGGTGAMYSYTWSTGSTLVNPVITETLAGTYSYTVTTGDVNNCTATTIKTVTWIPNPVFSCDNKDICYGKSVNLQINGNASNYVWGPSTALSATTGVVVSASPLATTVYSIVGSNLFCNTVRNVTVGVIQYPDAKITPVSQEICAGNSTTINVSGAMGNNWMPNYAISSLIDSSVVVSPMVSTTYTITSYNFSGTVVCSETKMMPILVIPQVTPSISNNIAVCIGEKVTLRASGGNTFLWKPNSGLNSNNTSAVVANPSVTTVYTVHVSNNGSCGHDATVSVVINLKPTVFAGKDSTFNLDEPMFIRANGTGTLTWISGDGIYCRDCPETKIVATQSGCYVIETVNEFGCKASDEVCIEVTLNSGVYIPNGFTPNDDGLNDVFLVYGYSISDVTMEIFDKWGEKLFSSSDQKLGWNGTYKGTICKNDSYVYKVGYKSLDGKKHFKTGYISINR